MAIYSMNLTMALITKAMKKNSIMRNMKIIAERFPYRYVEMGTLDNGFPDYRIQKFSHASKRYSDMYLCDNSDQLMLAIEDFEYSKWLDPERPPCYTRSRIRNPYPDNHDSIN